MKSDWIGKRRERRVLIGGFLGSVVLWYILSALYPDACGTVVFGVFIQVMGGASVAFALHSWLLRRHLSKWDHQRNDVVEEFACSLTPQKEWPREEIIQLLVRAPRGAPLKDDFQKTLTPDEARRSEERWIWWFDVSKLLIKIGMLCREKSRRDLEDAVRSRYIQVSEILRLYLKSRLGGRLFFQAVFLGAFLSLNQLMAWHVGISRQHHYLEWIVPVTLVIIGISFALLLYYALQLSIRRITERTWTDLDDTIVSILSGPLSAAVIVASAYRAISVLPSEFKMFVHGLRSYLIGSRAQYIISLLVVSWVAVYIFNYVIIYGLRRWAQRTALKYDEFFVGMLQLIGTFAIIAFAATVILIQLEPAFWVIASIITAILGFASRTMTENFVGGIMLQIDKPFEPGDRLMLSDGQVCDVVEVGMRSTTLYNVGQNSLISIPNRNLSTQEITNVSKPDPGFRLDIHIYVPDKPGSIEEAEAHLLDIAYCYAETDRARLRGAGELTEEHLIWGHTPLDEELENLVKIYPEITQDRVRRINAWISPYEDITQNMKKLLQLRTEIRGLRPSPGEPEEDKHRHERLQLLKEHIEVFRIICERTYAIADLYPQIRADMYPIFRELYREPTVVAEFLEPKEEPGCVKLTFRVFATHAERTSQVQHKLIKDIQGRFAELFGPEARLGTSENTEKKR